SDRQPFAAVAREQKVGCMRTGAAGRIVWKVLGWVVRPRIEQWLNGLPGCFHGIGALKQSGIAQQTIVDQRLVTDRDHGCKIAAVCEVHSDAVDLDLLTWPLGAEADRQAFIGLDAQHEDVWRQMLDRRIAK